MYDDCTSFIVWAVTKVCEKVRRERVGQRALNSMRRDRAKRECVGKERKRE